MTIGKQTILNTVLGILLFASPSWAAIYYVDNAVGHGGSDSNAGTSPWTDATHTGSPWLTIQKAANTVVAGDDVKVLTGDYPERVTITTSGTNGSPILFEGVGGVVTMLGFQVVADYNNLTYFTIATKTAALIPVDA